MTPRSPVAWVAFVDACALVISFNPSPRLVGGDVAASPARWFLVPYVAADAVAPRECPASSASVTATTRARRDGWAPGFGRIMNRPQY